MERVRHVPERGDIIKLNLSPTKGHEQRGYRPMLVLSWKKFNAKGGLAIACPITSKIRKDPFETTINTLHTKGVILVDQIRTIDWMARRVKYVGECPTEALREVSGKLSVLIGG